MVNVKQPHLHQKPSRGENGFCGVDRPPMSTSAEHQESRGPRMLSVGSPLPYNVILRQSIWAQCCFSRRVNIVSTTAYHCLRVSTERSMHDRHAWPSFSRLRMLRQWHIHSDSLPRENQMDNYNIILQS